LESNRATTRIRSATAEFDFPSVSYISEHEFDADDASGYCPYSLVAVLVSMQPNPYRDLFAFWPDALRSFAENNAGEIFGEWDHLSGDLSCKRLAPAEMVSRLRDALAPFSGSSNLPALPDAFSQAFEVLGVRRFNVYIGTSDPDEERHLFLAVEGRRPTRACS
jgi:hypothetical protein